MISIVDSSARSLIVLISNFVGKTLHSIGMNALCTSEQFLPKISIS
jgi:hypothetical protein